MAEPPRLLAMNWGGHELRFEITPVPTGVRLSLTHTFDVEEEAADYASGWHLCLNALSARLDGKDKPPVAGPAAREYGWQELRDEYALMSGSEWPKVIGASRGWSINQESLPGSSSRFRIHSMMWLRSSRRPARWLPHRSPVGGESRPMRRRAPIWFPAQHE